jgi:hypothetical protein
VGDKDDTANPSAKPPEEPQKSVHAEPQDPADEGAGATPGDGDSGYEPKSAGHRD